MVRWSYLWNGGGFPLQKRRGKDVEKQRDREERGWGSLYVVASVSEKNETKPSGGEGWGPWGRGLRKRCQIVGELGRKMTGDESLHRWFRHIWNAPTQAPSNGNWKSPIPTTSNSKTKLILPSSIKRLHLLPPLPTTNSPLHTYLPLQTLLSKATQATQRHWCLFSVLILTAIPRE